MADELDIDRLGAQGDGIAITPQGPRYVPFALPGERVRLVPDEAPEIVTSSPERAVPVCRHFGACGGCIAQHMSPGLYAEWKRGIVVEALRQHGIDADVAPLRRAAPGSRRRAVLTARRENGRIAIGYHRRKSHDLIDIEECPILVSDIAERVPALRALVELLRAPEVRMTVVSTQGGLDIAVEGRAGPMTPQTRAALAQLATEHKLARIAADGETIVERAAPALPLGGVSVVPPPGAFLQASEPAEQEMRALIAGAVRKAKQVADLFCGIGTWTFALAQHAKVLAVDGDQIALDALAAAARKAQGLKPIETRARDLFREPLSPMELKGFDAVVFDPPRAGAKAQAAKLAQSAVPTVVAVSCDPGTLARDLRILIDGGYTLGAVTPVDQFEFSSHVETIAVLTKPRASRR